MGCHGDIVRLGHSGDLLSLRDSTSMGKVGLNNIYVSILEQLFKGSVQSPHWTRHPPVLSGTPRQSPMAPVSQVSSVSWFHRKSQHPWQPPCGLTTRSLLEAFLMPADHLTGMLEGRKNGFAPYCTVSPPSRTSTAPVVNEDSSLARKSAAFAISSGVPSRPSGMMLPSFWSARSGSR